MRLARRLILVVLGGVVILVAIGAYASMRRSVRLFDREMESHATLMGRALGPVVRDAWLAGGLPKAQDLLAKAGSENQSIGMVLVTEEGELDGLESWQLTDLRQGRVVSFRTAGSDDDTDTRQTLVPILSDSTWVGAIRLTESLGSLRQYRSRALIDVLILASSIALLGAVAIPALGIRLVGRPLELLVDKARRVGRGHLDGPLHLGRHDELEELASAMNSMCERLAEARDERLHEHAAKLKALEQARHRDRLHTIGEVAAGIAHELGTPLNVIAGRAAMIARDELSIQRARELAVVIEEQAHRMHAMVEDLLRYGRRRSPGMRPTNLETLIRSTLDVLRPLARKHGVALRLTVERVSDVEIDPAQIRQVVTNLVLNAIQASEAGSRVDVRVDRVHDDPSDPSTPVAPVRLTIRDRGQGMTEDTRRRLFDPFFTTKRSGEGTGLGLSIAQGILADHGARIIVTSDPGEGSEFQIHFPVSSHG